MAWLTGWKKRKSKTIDGSIAGIQTDYQMMLIVHKSSGTDTPTDIYLGTNVNNDFSDVRFTSSDGSTLLSYWIESYTSGSIATIWIKIPSIPASPSTTITYIYYDNALATSLSNGDNTFIFFDDFPGTSLDPIKWTSGSFQTTSYGPGSATVSNSIAILTGGYNTWWGMFANGAPVTIPPFTVEMLYKGAGGNVVGVETTGTLNPSPKDAAYFNFSAPNYGSCSNNVCIEEGILPLASSYRLLRIDIYAGGIKYYMDRSLIYTKTTNVPNGGMKAFISAAQSSGIGYTDWIFTRKYANPEPIFSTTGVEEIFQLFDTLMIAGD